MLTSLDFELPEILDRNVFNDTKDENILICNQLGIIDGIGSGNFDPYSSLSREQGAKILINICNLLEIDTNNKINEDVFVDFNEVSDWAKDSVLKVASLKTHNNKSIMGGTSENIFSPNESYTVEQAVTTLVRLLDLYQ